MRTVSVDKWHRRFGEGVGRERDNTSGPRTKVLSLSRCSRCQPLPKLPPVYNYSNPTVFVPPFTIAALQIACLIPTCGYLIKPHFHTSNYAPLVSTCSVPYFDNTGRQRLATTQEAGQSLPRSVTFLLQTV
ncbi:hypothetical protein J6590_034828 [Homalodisca vitripennis]|nr:hypothetical protein J6590_034828 [Homalodisca vitripennis]